MSELKQQQNAPLEWPPDEQWLVPLEQRQFGPHFEKPCRNPDTIICAARSCQATYSCRYQQWRKAVARR